MTETLHFGLAHCDQFYWQYVWIC